MNILYTLLTYLAPSGASEYTKCTSSVSHTDTSRRICNKLIENVPASRYKIFACYLCWLATKTKYWPEIKKLDSLNTYCEPASAQTSALTPSACLYDMTASNDSMRALIAMLDADLRDSLTPAPWLDVAAAACLQMLREVAAK